MFVALRLDTSVLIQGYLDPLDKVAISAVSIAELHFGALVTSDDEVRAQRLQRLAKIEETFSPLPLLTLNAADFKLIDDLVDVRSP